MTFMWNGATYEIDLSKKNATALEKALTPYLQAGRKVRGSVARSRRTAARARADLAAVRVWAKKNGYEVSERGRIAGAVLEAYHAGS